MKLENIKIKIKSPEHSRQVQEMLFRMGYRWHVNGKKISYQDASILYAYFNQDIRYSNDEVRFDTHENKEIWYQENPTYEIY